MSQSNGLRLNLRINFINTYKTTLTATLFEWLLSTRRPEIDEMEGTSRVIRNYWARFDEITAVEGVLGLKVYKNEINDCTFRAIVPRRLRQEILERSHASADGGYFRVHKTINKLKQRFHWLRLTMYATGAPDALHVIATRLSNKIVLQCNQ